MRVYTRIVWDADLNVVEESSTEYFGPVDLCKGGNSKTEMAAAQQQQAMENQLAQQQLSMQQQQIGMVNPTLQSIIANGGMPPSTEAAMNSIALNSLPQQYNNLIGQINNRLTARGVTGGQNAGGGDIARDFGQLGSQEAGQQAGLLEGVQQQKFQGLQDAMRTTLGIGSMYGQNVGTFNQGASSALGTGTQAAQAADQASTGFWGSLFGALTSPFRISASV